MSAPVIPRRGPDRTVFGLPLGPPYQARHGLLGLTDRRCITCDVRGAGDRCWCCGQPFGNTN